MTAAAAELTDRQRRILEGLARGQRVKEIASDLSISSVWAYATLQNAKEILNAKTTTGAVVAALMGGAIDLPDPADMTPK